MPKYAGHLKTFGDIGFTKRNDLNLTSKLTNRGVACMMLGYATSNATGTYRLLNLETSHVFKSRNVRWTNKSYGMYKREILVEDVSDSDDDFEVDDDSPIQNQGEISASPPSIPTRRVTFQEGSETIEPVSARTRSKTTPTANLAQELKDLETSFLSAKQKLFTEHMLMSPDDVAHGLMALVGGTDTSKEIPLTFREAWDHADPVERKLWREAIRKEFRDMIRRQVWRHHRKRDVPSNRRLISNKWVFRIKNDGRHRARLCAIGYTQIAGIDHQDNFAPLLNDVTFRIIMTLLIANQWDADIVDIETAFLYGDLYEEIYMKIPEGLKEYYDKTYDDDECFILDKAMYGLVQAARQYYKKFVDIMTSTEMGFERCLADGCLLKRSTEVGTVIVCVYVDDTMCVGDRKAIDAFKRELKDHFSTKDEGNMEEYVGCSVYRKNNGSIVMHQPHLLKKIGREFGEELEDVRTYATPAVNGDTVIRMKDDDKEEISLNPTKQTKYRSGVGMLLYLVKFSRPDISNSVRELSKVMDRSTEAHYRTLLRVLKYVLLTEDLGLRYDSGILVNFNGIWQIVAFCDSDFAGDKDTRISVTGFCIYIGKCLVSWRSRGQKSVTLSSTEAEYVAVSEVCAEIIYIKQVLEFLGMKIEYPITVNCDNVGAIFLAHNQKNSQRTKHVDIRAHYVRQYVEDGIVKVIFVKSENNAADVYTKNVSGNLFKLHGFRDLEDVGRK